jgi:bleomycin hydrolase
MKKFFVLVAMTLAVYPLVAQPTGQSDVSPDPTGVQAASGIDFVNPKKNFTTGIKDQQRTGTCWSFSTTSLVESQTYKNRLGAYDLSEMFTVRNIYLEKAKNYILRQGHAQFSEGGLGHDLIRTYSIYGAVPEQAYSGMVKGMQLYDHEVMLKQLSKYVDSVVKSGGNGLKADWLPGFQAIMDQFMGPMPSKFNYNGKQYTPEIFARNVLQFKADEYINITSFTHHPYYQPFILEVPDNFSNGAYYNLPLNEMIQLVTNSVSNGFTVLWDTDVSNSGFSGKSGYAMFPEAGASANEPDAKEAAWDAATRQRLFENLTTQDDHLMHIVGMEKSKQGKTFFIVKNSWGDVGKYHGYLHASESYFAINTISLVVPKAAIPQALLDKLKLK